MPVLQPVEAGQVAPVNDHLSLRLLPDLLGHDLGSLYVATEHHHLGSPPAHVEGGELANASIAASDRHNLAVQPRFAGALGSLHEPPEEVEEESDNKNPSKKSAYPSTSKSSTLKSHDWPQDSMLSLKKCY